MIEWILGVAGMVVTGKNSSTYLFTPWCRVLLEKLTGLQLVKKFPAFHGAQRFITAFRVLIKNLSHCFFV